MILIVFDKLMNSVMSVTITDAGHFGNVCKGTELHVHEDGRRNFNSR